MKIGPYGLCGLFVALRVNAVDTQGVADELGVTHATVRYWATGERRPTERQQERIAELLGVPREFLFSKIVIPTREPG